jgi:hypothetical protein
MLVPGKQCDLVMIGSHLISYFMYHYRHNYNQIYKITYIVYLWRVLRHKAIYRQCKEQTTGSHDPGSYATCTSATQLFPFSGFCPAKIYLNHFGSVLAAIFTARYWQPLQRGWRRHVGCYACRWLLCDHRKVSGLFPFAGYVMPFSSDWSPAIREYDIRLCAENKTYSGRWNH